MSIFSSTRLSNSVLVITILRTVALELCEADGAQFFPQCENGGCECSGFHAVPLREQRVPAKSKGPFALFKSVFSGAVRVGSTEYSVVFDSGSGHLVLPAASCTSLACLVHKRYNVTESVTGTDIEFDGTPVIGANRDQLTVSFGTGEITGVFVRESVCVGHWGSPVCTDANVITATAMSDNPFLQFGFDGVFGLGLPGLSQTADFNLGSQLAGLGNGMFAVRLTGSPEITFGGYREEYLAEPLAWVPVADPEEGYWKLRLSAVLIGGEALELCADGCFAVADTGTSVFAGPAEAVTRLREELQDSTVAGGRCSHVNRGIELVLENGATLALHAKELSQPRLPLGSEANATAEEGTGCELMIMKLTIPPPLGPLFVVGVPFLAKYYTVFDTERQRVGFGLSNRDALPQRPHANAAAV